MTKYVLGFAFTPDWQSVLLVTKARPDWQRGLFNGLGGKVKVCESGVQAMHREFKEESGLAACYWMGFATMQGHDFSVECYWAVEPWEYLDSAPEEGDEPVGLYNINNLRENRRYDTVPNLFMLLEAAHAHAARNQPILQIVFP